jgi:glycoside hydrolase-like protein
MHGLDRAAAPSAAKAKSMLDEIGGSWWNVYIGGPRSGGSGWTPEVLRDYRAQGITRFLLTYVGRQQGDVHLLNRDQGRRDGEEACQIAGRFGFGQGTPLCLDLENATFEASPRGSVDYVCGWADAVRGRGLRPGVYANRPALNALASRADRPAWAWVASWVRHTVDHSLDQHRIPRLHDGHWSAAGERAWQYAGAFDGEHCRVGGLDVDINVADAAVLAGAGGTPTPQPADLEEDDMFTFGSQGKPTFFVAGGKAAGLNEEADLVAIRNGLKPAPLPHFQFDADTYAEFLKVFRD